MFFFFFAWFVVVDIDYCINVTCKNGGSCVDGLNNYTCSCVDGFQGDHCETGNNTTTSSLVIILGASWPPAWQLEKNNNKEFFCERAGKCQQWQWQRHRQQQQQQQNPPHDCTKVTDLV